MQVATEQQITPLCSPLFAPCLRFFHILCLSLELVGDAHLTPYRSEAVLSFGASIGAAC